jgi:hypothetical protein
MIACQFIQCRAEWDASAYVYSARSRVSPTVGATRSARYARLDHGGRAEIKKCQFLKIEGAFAPERRCLLILGFVSSGSGLRKFWQVDKKSCGLIVCQYSRLCDTGELHLAAQATF